MSDSLFPLREASWIIADVAVSAKRLELTDRVTREAPVRVETLQTAGCCNQWNLGRVAAPEIVDRREQLISEANTNPRKPNWDTSKFFTGSGGAGDAVSTELWQHELKEANEAVDV